MKNSLLLLLFLLVIQSSKAQVNANFIFTNQPNGKVTFTSTSTPTTVIVQYDWYYGDGMGESNYVPNNPPNLNAQHIFSVNGTYSVTLTVEDTANTFPSITKTISITSITNTACNNMTAIIRNTQAVNNVMYYDAYTSAWTPTNAIYNWNFGDNTTGAGLYPPAHTYSAAGNYVVTLTITVPSSTCISIDTQTINAQNIPCFLNANYTTTTGPAGMVNFNSTSTGTLNNATYEWGFGDGAGVVGPMMNVSHTYSANGTYTPYLFISNPVGAWCVDTIYNIPLTVTNAVTQTCSINSSFALVKDQNQNFTWYAYPYYPSNTTQVSWAWGDGSTSSGLYPSHTYSAAGTYSICMTISVSCGSQTTTCYNSNIYKTDQSNSMITVNMVNPITVGMQKNSSEATEVTLYPNPTSGEFKLSYNFPGESPLKIVVYNSLGELAAQLNISRQENKTEPIDLSSLPAGSYFMKIDVDGSVLNKRLIIIK